MSGLTIRNFADAQAAGDVYYNAGVPYDASGALLVSGNKLGELARKVQRGRSRPTAMGFGNSIMLRNIPSYSTTNQIISYGNVQWAMALLGQPFRWARTGAKTAVDSGFLSYGIFAYSGATSVQLEPYVATQITPYSPDVCFLQVMENDVVAIDGGTITRAQAQAAYVSIIRTLLASGIVPIWIQCYPSKAFTSAAHATEFWALTHYIEELASSVAELVIVDSAYDFQDSSLDAVQPFSSGNFADYWDASVHPQLAAVYLGKKIADTLTTHGFGEFCPLPGGADSRSVNLNPYMGGSGGTAGTGWSGTVSESWRTANTTLSGSPTLTADVVDSGGTREALELTIAAAGPETGIEDLAEVLNSSSSTSNFAVGDYVQGFVDFEFVSSTAAVGFHRPQMTITFNGGSNNPSVMVHSDAINMPVLYDRKIRLATHEMQVPASTTSILARAYLKGASGLADGAALKARIHYLNVVNWSNG